MSCHKLRIVHTNVWQPVSHTYALQNFIVTSRDTLDNFFFSNISKFSSRHDTHYFTWPASPSIPTLVVTSYSVSHWCYGYKFRGDLSVCKRNKAFVCRLILYFYVFFFLFFLCTSCTISILIIIIIINNNSVTFRGLVGGQLWSCWLVMTSDLPARAEPPLEGRSLALPVLGLREL